MLQIGSTIGGLMIMPKKSVSPKVSDFILTSDGFFGIIVEMNDKRATVRYFDDGIDNGEQYADTQQEFHIADIEEMRADFLKRARLNNAKSKW